MGAQLVKEAAIKTNDIVGDGTTTATVLAHAIVREGMQAIGAGGNPVLVKRGIDLAVGRLVEHLREVAHPVVTEQRLRPGGGDLGQRRRHGRRGDRQGAAHGRRRRHRHGRGVAAHGMTRRLRRGLRVRQRLPLAVPGDRTRPAWRRSLDDPYILLCSEKITKVQQLMPLLDKIMRAPRPLVIIAENVEGTALSACSCTTTSTASSSASPCGRPGFGDRRLHKLEDIAAITGGAVLQQALRLHAGDDDRSTSSAGPTQVRVTADRTAIIGGAGAPAGRRVPARPSCGPSWSGPRFGVDEDVLTERIGALSGKVAVIQVGAPTHAELKELQHRVEDALSATRAAMAEGIVAGGGVALLHAAHGARRARGQGRLRDRRGHRPAGAHRAGVPDRHATRATPAQEVRRRRSRELGPDDGFDALRGPLRQHGRDGHRRPAAGVPVGAAERRLGGRAAAHHEHAGRRGADAVGRQRRR